MAPQRVESPVEPEELEFDSQQDVARGGFADMLFDTSRVCVSILYNVLFYF